MKNLNPYVQAAIHVAVFTALLLSVPLIAMLFTPRVNWDFFDFAIAGIIIFAHAYTFRAVTLQSDQFIFKIAMGFALLSGLFLLWSNLAVGIIGAEDNPANVMYLFVFLIGLMGSFLARFRAQQMSVVLFITAAAQALTVIIALSMGMQNYPHSSVMEIFAVNGFFIVLFSTAGLLFKQAAKEEKEPVAGQDA